MPAAANQRLQALGQQLAEGIPDEGVFEGIPRIRHVASDSTGPRVQKKVVMVTGRTARGEAREAREPEEAVVPEACFGPSI